MEEPLKYLCLVYQDEQQMNALSRSDYNTLVAETLAYDEELRQSGHYVTSNALECVEAATSVRVRGARMAITDGPFVETREQLGGYLLIEARDLNEAIRVASKMPPAQMGGIEVRPVKDLSPR